MHDFSHNLWQKRLELLKILYNIEEIKGKFIFQKTIFILKYFGIKNLNYNFQRHEFGPYSFELENEIVFFEKKNFINIENYYNKNRIIANKEKIENYFNRKGYSLRLNSEEGMAICKTEDLFNNELKELKSIELTASMLQLINEGKYNLKKEIIKELRKWKPCIFSEKDIEKIWNLLFSKKIIPEILRNLNLLLEIKPGEKEAHKYHKLISKIIAYIFRKSFRNMEFERGIHKGRKYIDTIYTNSAQTGFFKNLPEKNNIIICNYVIMEAKNYSYDPENPEFDQLASRLNKKVGNFGILVFRKVKNKKIILERCQSYLDDDKYIIFLSDDDIIELVELSRLGLDAEINDYIDNKFKSLIFRS